MQTKQTTAYDLFVEAHAAYIGKSPEQIAAETTSDEFEELLSSLHHQYMEGQFSMGRFTELIQVPHLELWEILEVLGLPIHV